MGPYTYETIGTGYTHHRRADPRLARLAVRLLALPRGSTVIDIGAGTGNYAAAFAAHGYQVVALEPSRVMRRQAGARAGVHWVAGVAEALPRAAGTAHGTICTLAVHHLRSVPDALCEMRRVVPAGPLAIFTFDPRLRESWWFEAYFPTLWHEAFRLFPPLSDLIQQLQAVAERPVDVVAFPLPPNLADRFAAAGWRDPRIYLDPAVRAGMSPFALADPAAVEDGVARLAHDLRSGDWQRKYARLLRRKSLDAGHRFLTAR